jgi:hypothetical protein
LDVLTGRVYFIADDFFNKVDDPYLKIEYAETKRPHYFAFKEEAASLPWLVPVSSKVEKFERIIRQRKERGKASDGIRIVMLQDMKRALLFQDMFPTIERYISEPYIRGGQPVLIADPKTVQALEKQAAKVIALLRRGIKFTPTSPDVPRIEKLMTDELKNEK